MENETDDSLSTQEMIEDARERRKIGKDQLLKCDHCEFTSPSINLLKKHNKNSHKKLENKKETDMRPRYNCDKCQSKTTSEYVLQRHINMHHEKISKTLPSKRKTCELCGKQFNKEHTLKNHMQTTHKQSLE